MRIIYIQFSAAAWFSLFSHGPFLGEEHSPAQVHFFQQHQSALSAQKTWVQVLAWPPLISHMTWDKIPNLLGSFSHITDLLGETGAVRYSGRPVQNLTHGTCSEKVNAQ